MPVGLLARLNAIYRDYFTKGVRVFCRLKAPVFRLISGFDEAF